MEHLSPEEVRALRARLEQLVTDLEVALDGSRGAAATVELDPCKVGRLSRIDAIQAQRIAQATRARSKLRLQQVRAALDAMDRDEYGLCRLCDDPIPLERLARSPESPLCLACQREVEARGR